MPANRPITLCRTLARVPRVTLRRAFVAVVCLTLLMFGNRQVAADAAAGKDKAASCAACHGENGVSQTDSTPSLAAQPDQFLQWQLVFFRSGARKSEIMVPVAEQLSNEDIRDLAAYFASLMPPDASAAKQPDDHPDLTEAAKKTIAAGRCVSCHGDNFSGNKAVARISGQREDYLLKALHDYKAGIRTGTGVAAMADVAYQLSERDISTLAHYLSRL